MDVRIDENLWATSMAPEGLLERWRVAPCIDVRRGETIAEVLIEDSRHEITSPIDGRLVRLLPTGALIEPGALIARIAT
ncbi:MAG: pdhC [Caulobacteraceae bacterium]|nr:pdhC [Caulobacteraceae bacterium]